MPKFFISYVYEDRAFCAQLADWSAKKQLSDWEAVTEKEDVRTDGANAVRRHLSPLIQSSQVVLVLVGNNSHNRPWLDYEIQNARSAERAIVSVRLPNTTGGPPKTVPEPTTKFDPASILTALKAATKPT